MKIVENNNTVRVTCDSVLDITIEDIIDYEMSGTYVRCPACKRLTSIPTNIIPKDWWNYIEEV